MGRNLFFILLSFSIKTKTLKHNTKETVYINTIFFYFKRKLIVGATFLFPSRLMLWNIRPRQSVKRN